MKNAHGDIILRFVFFVWQPKSQKYLTENEIKPRKAANRHIWEAWTREISLFLPD